MSCLSVTITRSGSLAAEVAHVPSDVRAAIERTGGPSVAFTRQGGLLAGAERVKVTAILSRVCDTSIRVPYLEIEPTVLWVYPDLENSNDVSSNTYWKVK